jgi:hypothetical protein
MDRLFTPSEGGGTIVTHHDGVPPPNMVVVESIHRLHSCTACLLPAITLGLYVLYCRVDTQKMKTVLHSSSHDMGYLYNDSTISTCHRKMTEDDTTQRNMTQGEIPNRELLCC